VNLDLLIVHELRSAVRSLRHGKGFAAVAILCLGLGIGINTAIFSIIDGVLLKPYPYDDPGRIVVLGTVKLRDGDQAGVSVLDLRDWKAATKSFTTIAAVAGESLTVVDGAGEPERYQGARVSWDLWRLLGVRPILGRDFAQSDDQPNAAGVVLLSHMLWATRYSSDPNVVGRGIDINGTLHTIVGVMPPNFAFPNNQRLWVTLQPALFRDARNARYLFTFGRLRPEVTPARALADLNSIAARLERVHPATNEGWSASLRTLQDAFLPYEVALILGLMMAGATMVLLIACSNVANLLLARATARRRELAVRVALGAGRGRIVVHLLTEAVVLALASVPFGLVLAVAGSRLIRSLIPPDTIPYYVHWSVDGRSLAYSLAIAVSTALAFGLVPALHVTRRELQESLKEGGRGIAGSGAITRNALVVSQVSLALVALVGALLFVRSFNNLDSDDLGFDTEASLTLRFFMTGDAYRAQDAKHRRVEDIVQRVEALPGVEAAFASDLVPIQGGGDAVAIEVEGRAADDPMRASLPAVTPHALRTLGLRVRLGRDLSAADSYQSVAVINETMAKRLWPAENPIGRRFRVFTSDRSREWIAVIGVAPDMRLFGFDPSNSQPPAAAFVPYLYGVAENTGLTVRARVDPAAIAPAVRAAIRDSDPRLPVFAVRTLEDVRRLEFWQFGLYGWVFGTIGVISASLASIGVYGVLAYSVAQRTHEIGVRMTLGATGSDVVMLIVGHGLALTGIGVAIGLVLAAFGTAPARSLLYNVSPLDPLSFILVPIMLAGVAVVASYVPARRAMRIEPVVALRQD
jgi:putative ABC transport system permease protein